MWSFVFSEGNLFLTVEVMADIQSGGHKRDRQFGRKVNYWEVFASENMSVCMCVRDTECFSFSNWLSWNLCNFTVKTIFNKGN